MNYTLIGNHQKDKRPLRDGYIDTILDLMGKDPTIVHVDADLFNCIGSDKLYASYPDRVINAGIAEANAMGIAAGLSATGKKAYMHSFGCFASRRAFDQAFLSIAYSKLNVCIIGSDPGVSASYNGGTHMPFEDAALYMTVPDAIVIDICDYAQAVSVFRQANEIYGCIYVRLVRKDFITVYGDGSEFEIGKGVQIKDGTDVTIISSGIMVDEALKAHEILAEEGISARVIDLFTWKPLDHALIARCAAETGAVVTAENHTLSCGLGSAVAASLAKSCPTPMEFVGVEDRFGQVGPVDFLQREYGLTAKDIVKKVKLAIAKK